MQLLDLPPLRSALGILWRGVGLGRGRAGSDGGVCLGTPGPTLPSMPRLRLR